MTKPIRIVPNSTVFYACDTSSGDAFDTLKACLETMCDELGLTLKVFDKEVDTVGHGFLSKIQTMIINSICVVADVGCSEKKYGECHTNPNVAMEVGIAKSAGVPTILITKKGKDRVLSNLSGQDHLYYPECVKYGNQQFNILKSIIATAHLRSIVGLPVQIFSSQSKEYLELIYKITAIPSKILWTGPEFRSFMRPVSVLERWLKEVRKCDKNEIHGEIAKRKQRYSDWTKTLSESGGIDIYPKKILKWDRDEWRGMKITSKEKKEYYSQLISLLDKYPKYEIVFSDEPCEMKYWMNLNPVQPIVVFEGWGYVQIRKKRFIGGIVFADDEIAKAFKLEFMRLYDSSPKSRNRKWVIEQIEKAREKVK